ncbi:MAG: hypothetical protein EA417_00300 [Gammaproteobacteria bacterium]|nr:MAG: hypothetical protein EA417_00300 [Gammaproteobacteria bacterium]
MGRQSGVALVQALLISALLLLLLTQLALTGRDQLGRAQAMLDRSTAEFALHSQEAALLYSLLTEPKWPVSASDNPYARLWRFDGVAFEVDGVRLRLQDQSGLVPLNWAGEPRFLDLLVQLGLGESAAAQVNSSLHAALRAGQMPQSVSELVRYEALTPSLLEQLSEVITLYPVTALNPRTAPLPVVAMFVSPAAMEAVTRLRADSEIDEETFMQLTGIFPDESINLAVGRGVGISISGRHGSVWLQRDGVVSISPYSAEPLVLWGPRPSIAGQVP